MAQDECDELRTMVDGIYLCEMVNRYTECLLPIVADKKAIHSYWQEVWLSCMAGKGLDCLPYEGIEVSTLTTVSFTIDSSLEWQVHAIGWEGPQTYLGNPQRPLRSSKREPLHCMSAHN